MGHTVLRNGISIQYFYQIYKHSLIGFLWEPNMFPHLEKVGKAGNVYFINLPIVFNTIIKVYLPER